MKQQSGKQLLYKNSMHYENINNDNMSFLFSIFSDVGIPFYFCSHNMAFHYVKTMNQENIEKQTIPQQQCLSV